jgi:hypothetical protein
VIYLSPLDAHTRGVADAIITRNPRPGVTFQLRPGKQPLFRAQAQLDRLTAHSHSTQYSYTIRSDGSLTRAATPCWSPYYPDSPPVGEVISRPGSATTMIVCGG